ncbi:hypothetical protein FKW77_003968 [Venturia effusa]|uniref:SnoaL-like domain-containing protein n=1 Tax=Venturia effusa TaxID=50376 RepID=A0A517LMM6_9PEZI|nr:hypothetical protein FKW77_003968 [Venturia effusa]
MPTDLKHQITTLLNTYLATFNASDYATASKYYYSPSIAISASGVLLLPAAADMASFLSTTVSRLKVDGFDHSEWIGEKAIVVLEDEGERGLL